jgi:predicted DNA-binding transcriptional regulator AlpA
MQSIPTGATPPETEELQQRRPMLSLAALPLEAVTGRILNSGQASQYWGVSLPHWRRLYRAHKVPAPIRISDRKYGWRLGDLVDALAERAKTPASHEGA